MNKKISPTIWLWVVQGVILTGVVLVLLKYSEKIGKPFGALSVGIWLCVFLVGVIQALLIHLIGTAIYHRFVETKSSPTLYDHINGVERAFMVAYRGGLWVEPQRSRLTKHYYDHLIVTAKKLCVLGIANKSFMKNFCGNLDSAETFNLSYAIKQPLFNALHKNPGMEVDVFFLDPTCQEASRRSGDGTNKDTLDDLLKVVKALDSVCEAFKEDSSNKNWKLNGKLRFWAFDRIPANSITLVHDNEAQRTVVVVGALPEGKIGEECPSVIVRRLPELTELFSTFSGRLDDTKKHSNLAFEWNEMPHWHVDESKQNNWLKEWLVKKLNEPPGVDTL